MDAVDETLREWRQHPFQYGEWDCIMSMARHFARMGGPDVVDQFRGTYSDHEGAMILLASVGGVDEAMHIMGGAKVDGAPMRGDAIGLPYRSEESEEDDLIIALCTGDHAAIRRDDCVIELPLRFLKWSGVWRVVP